MLWPPSRVFPPLGSLMSAELDERSHDQQRAVAGVPAVRVAKLTTTGLRHGLVPEAGLSLSVVLGVPGAGSGLVEDVGEGGG